MSETLDLLWQVIARDGGDERKRTFTTSDLVISRSAEHKFTRALTAVYEVPLGAITSTTTHKAVFVSTDKKLRVLFATSSVTNKGVIVSANGYLLTEVTSTGKVFVKTFATSTATIEVGVYLVS